MKRFLLITIISLLAKSNSYSQCTETDVTRVLLVGDSWANFMGIDQAVNINLEKWGHSNYKFLTNAILAENGTETTDFLQPAKLNEIAAQLSANPSIKIVHLSIGGNDVLNEWERTWSTAKTDSLLDSVYSRLYTLIDFIKVSSPGVKVLWSGYTYPNFGEIIEDLAPFQSSHPFYPTWEGMDFPDFSEINGLLNYFSDTIAALAALDPQVEFVKATGLMQYTFGQPTNLGVPPGGNYPAMTAPLPLGYPDYPSPKNSMRTYIIFRDCFHLAPQGYIDLLDYHTRKFYQKALMDDQYLISEGGTRDGSVSSAGSINSSMQLGTAGSEEFSIVLSFNTTTMPDTGVSKASIFLRRQNLTGNNPITGTLQVKIMSGNFGTTVDVESGDYAASGNAMDTPCQFGSTTDDGHWVRLELPASLLPYITHNNITQFIISAPALSGGLVTFSSDFDSDPELAPVLNLTYGPSSVSVAENLSQSQQIHVYPNPTFGNLVIDAGTLKIQEVKIINLQGKELLATRPHKNLIDLTQFPSGVYFLKFISDSQIITKKVIKN